ncbi:sigma-E processing peptidase SpoIIGA [Bittarella massiliensis (ex Durand et al. 2017)]|uniref:sigma-E processing peptidase SpoIIGA n=1 Tax=Bittarella massiliensis (ex Durand et al. 2017) TaxID=1720313 RepID=UPI001AA0C768|nr:sigma-E processing peptidase SpoIIGA [Bittarella massiliensis (ex Durand et al. 2017)]
MTVYLDVLVAINVFINYLLLLGTACLGGIPAGRLRILAASALSGLLSACILLPGFDNLFFKIALCILTVAVAFPNRSLAGFGKNALLFLLVNFVFAGAIMGLELAFSPRRMAYFNGVLYLDLPIGAFVLFAGLSYLLVEGVSWLSGRFSKAQYRVRVQKGGRETVCTGFVDTGNTLADPYTGDPVVLLSLSAAAPLLTAHQQLFVLSSQTKDPAGLRLIPYGTASGKALLPAFTPDRILVEDARGRVLCSTGRVCVGVVAERFGKGENDCILQGEIIGRTDNGLAAKTVEKMVRR